ncbi:hypothetical protein LTR50_007090 [Elasticomyces elasticus]|nr:hypothetical protein LTR50_007090 [Elasticomyces elasticus]
MPVPTRAIDVGDASRSPFLYITKGKAGCWTALSYCWGDDSTPKDRLTKDTFDSLKRGRPLADFPKTHQDAIIITRALGLKYLWIDALCIFQDLDDDWTLEASKMSETYTNAAIVIAATASTSVSAGVFGTRKKYLSPSLPWRLPEPERTMTSSDVGRVSDQTVRPTVHVRCIGRPWDPVMEIQDSRWASRGWTMQEHLLASRTLSYTRDQMHWECTTCEALEAGPVNEQSTAGKNNATTSQELKRLFLHRSQKSGAGIDQIPTARPYELWYHIVTRYSRRSLFSVHDRLPAIAGLAKYIQSSTGDSYCAGLWRADLIMGLLWRSLGKKEVNAHGYIGPSWSWVSLDSDLVRWGLRNLTNIEKLARIEKVDVKPVSPEAIFGRVQEGGKLSITAPFLYLHGIVQENVNSRRSPSKFQHFVYQVLQENVSLRRPSSKFQRFVYQVFENDEKTESDKRPLEFIQNHKPYPGQHFAALQIIKAKEPETGEPGLEVLLLESVKPDAALSPTSPQEILYRRIGLVALRRANSRSLNPEARPEFFKVGPVEDAAWREVARKKWPTKRVSII